MRGKGPFNLKKGQWTDDTSAALCLADSLLATRPEGGKVDREDYARRLEHYFTPGANSRVLSVAGEVS